jgi:chemotaxis protein histidine kinase CheA
MTTASGRKPALPQVLDALQEMFGAPEFSEREEDPLLDHLLVAVLARHLGGKAAREAIRAVSAAFLDLNEARNSPVYELVEVLRPFVPPERLRDVAYEFRMTLQDVWDGTHGLDLEPLRGRAPEDQRKFLKDLPNTPGGPAAAIFQLALDDDRLALGPREQHFLTRVGLLPRAASVAALRKNLEKKVKTQERVRFAWLTGAGSHAFETDWDPAHPFCRLLMQCRAREIVEREKARKRDELRAKAAEKKRQQDEEKARRRAEAEARRREQVEARKRREAEKKAREAERRKAAEARKVAARKAAEAKQRAAKGKEAAAKAARQAAQRAAAKKAARGRGAAPPAKKPSPAKSSAKRAPAKAAGPTKKPPARKQR